MGIHEIINDSFILGQIVQQLILTNKHLFIGKYDHEAFKKGSHPSVGGFVDYH